MVVEYDGFNIVLDSSLLVDQDVKLCAIEMASFEGGSQHTQDFDQF